MGKQLSITGLNPKTKAANFQAVFRAWLEDQLAGLKATLTNVSSPRPNLHGRNLYFRKALWLVHQEGLEVQIALDRAIRDSYREAQAQGFMERSRDFMQGLQDAHTLATGWLEGARDIHAAYFPQHA